MFTRLANTRVKKDVEAGAPSISVQAANRIVFSIEAITLLKLEENDRIDILKNSNTGAFYVANVGTGKEGRKLSKTRSMTHEKISLELGGKGNTYNITEIVVEVDGLEWFEIQLSANNVVIEEPTEVEYAEEVEA